MSTTHSLYLVQHWFQAAITNPDGVDAVEAKEIIQPSTRLNSVERLSIYANAYYARLLDCMGSYFPVLKRTLGEDVFNSFVLEYLQKHPSHSYTLDQLGDQFTRFLQDTRPDQENGAEDWPDFLIDLSTLEWTIAQTFDAEGSEGKQLLTAEMLKAIPAERFAEAKLLPVVSLRLLVFRFPVSAYYTAVKHAADQENIEIPDRMTECIAILRRDYIVRRYPLSEPQFVLLQKMFDGACVGDAISAAAEIMDTDDSSLFTTLQSWFQEWSKAGFFSGIR